ncbi:MAG: Zn-ribbon domain-containing OB-fold protein [Myxococcales bacterium]|nr:OB-fold domain-containing protein [Myxococcales bacterium]
MPDVSVLKCRKCGALDAGPRLLCPNCRSRALEAAQVEGKGTLLSWTIIRRAPAKMKALAPYAVCVVDLEAGVRVTGRLQAVDAALRPGARVRCAALEGGVAIFSAEA